MKIFGTVLLIIAMAFVFLVGVSIAASSHNIAADDRDRAMKGVAIGEVIGVLAITSIWLPWKKIIKSKKIDNPA